MFPARSIIPGAAKSTAQAPHKQQARTLAWIRMRRGFSQAATARHQRDRSQIGKSFTREIRRSSSNWREVMKLKTLRSTNSVIEDLSFPFDRCQLYVRLAFSQCYDIDFIGEPGTRERHTNCATERCLCDWSLLRLGITSRDALRSALSLHCWQRRACGFT